MWLTRCSTFTINEWMLTPPCRRRCPGVATIIIGVVSVFGIDETAQAQVARHVLIVANNLDPEGKLGTLRFADDDGARYAEIFDNLGARVELLTTLDAESQRMFPQFVGRARPPTRGRLQAALSHIFSDIRNDQAEGRDTEFLFVFTGHGRLSRHGVGQLVLADGALSRDDLLREVVSDSPAHFNHLLIDACHAYTMVMERGAWRDDTGPKKAIDTLSAYLDAAEPLTAFPRTGMVLSTAGAAEVHEWEAVRGGVFSHQLRSGLLGPADVNSDGQVTYSELEAFIVAANAGVTHPQARVQVFAQAPRQNLEQPLIDLQEANVTHVVHFPTAAAGHFAVEDVRGIRYADWHKAPDHPAYLALLYPPVEGNPRYFVRRGDQELRVRLRKPRGTQQVFEFRENRLVRARSAVRGSVEQSFRDELYRVPFGRAFVDGFRAQTTTRTVRAPPPRISLGDTRERSHHLATGVLTEAVAAFNRLETGLGVTYHWTPWQRAYLLASLGWIPFRNALPQGPQERAAVAGQSLAVNGDKITFKVGAGVTYSPVPRLRLFADVSFGNTLMYMKVRRLPSDANETVRAQAEWDAFIPNVTLGAGARWHLLEPLFLQTYLGAELSLLQALGTPADRRIAPWFLLSLGFSFSS